MRRFLLMLLPCLSAVAQTPVVYYNFEEGAGSTVTNLATGATVHGALLGAAPAWVAGAPGAFSSARGLRFDGNNVTNNGVRVQTGFTPATAGVQDADYTMAAWVRFEKTAGDNIVFGQIPATGTTDWLHNGIRDLKQHQGHFGADLTSLYNLSTGVWYHLTWVYQGGAATGVQRIYLNGQLDRAVGDRIRVRRNDPLLIGTAEAFNTARSFRGVLDDLVIYSNALTRTQIAFLAAGGNPNALPAPALADREFYTARLGAGNTWNLYEVVGFRHGAPATWWQAHQAALVTDPVAGSGLTGHLVSIGSANENEFVRRRLHTQHPDYQYTAIESAWIGLTDDTSGQVTFSNPEGGNTTTVPTEAARRAAFARWTDNTAVTYSNWSATQPDDAPVTGPGEDAVELQTNGQWNDTRSGIPGTGQDAGAPDNLYVIEWDVQSAVPLETVNPAIRRADALITIPVPGPAGAADSWAGRWIRCPAAPGDMYGSMRQILLSQQPGYAGTTIIQTNNIPYINHFDPQFNNPNQGLFGNDLPFFGNNPAVTNDTNFVAIFRGVLRVRPGHAGQWTISTRSDDGFLLKVGNLKWEKAYGLGQIDHGDDTVLFFPNGTGNSDTRGVINLPVGDHPITYITFQGGGGTYHELFAAKGDFATEGATAAWQLVGNAGAAEIEPRLGVADPGNGLGWTVWHSKPGAHGAIGNTGVAYTVVYPNYVVPDTNRTHWASINFYDEGSGNNAASGSIAGSVRFPFDTNATANADVNVAMFLRTTLVAPAAGTYYLGFQGDDGSWLRVVGQTWNSPIPYSAIPSPNSYIERDRLVVGIGTGNSRTIGSITLAAGTYDVEMLWWQGSGGAHLEVLQGSPANTPVAALAGNTSMALLTTGGATIIQRPVLPLVSPLPPVITITPVTYEVLGGNVSLTFNTERLATYAIESSIDYTNWSPVPGQSGLTGTGGLLNRTFPDNFGETFRVFRVVRSAP